MKIIVAEWLIVAAFALLAVTGCSVSYSGEKSSDSISQSLDSISASFDSFSSISDSSGSAKEEVTAALDRFLADVSGLVRGWTAKQEGAGDFEYQLGALAMNYGIGDWERVPGLFYAIGAGLQQAGTDRDGITSQPFLQSGIMIRNSDLIASGYWGT